MACMEENEIHTGYQLGVGGGGKLTHRLEDDIKIDLKEIVWDGVDWINLAWLREESVPRS